MKKLYLSSFLALIVLSGTLKAHKPVILIKNSQLTDLDNPYIPDYNITELHDTAYCYIAYDNTFNRYGPAKFSLADPGNIILLADQTGTNYISSGTWGLGNKWFGITSTENTLVTINPLTGERVLLGATGQAFSGISFDFTTGTLYGVSWDGLTSSLYSINTVNGTSTLIGQCVMDILINLASDEDGDLYSVGINNDVLYKINKLTGAAVVVGSIGTDANYEQDMEFDLNAGILYMAAYNSNTSSGELRTVDKSTGATTLIGAFQGGAEISGLCIPNNSIHLNNSKLANSMRPVRIYPNPGPGIFILESNYIGNSIEVTDILGKSICSAQLRSGKVKIDLSKQQKGIYFFRITDGKRNLDSGKILIE